MVPKYLNTSKTQYSATQPWSRQIQTVESVIAVEYADSAEG